MVNKELHFTHSDYCRIQRGMAAINEIFGCTGNYRTLAEELSLLDQTGFETQAIQQLPRSHYQRTIDRWLSNMCQHRDELQTLVGVEYYQRFRCYLRLARGLVNSRRGTVDIVVARKP
jgi:cyclopropane fatty-acyl-phospholipid synthase-like methyltransferase